MIEHAENFTLYSEFKYPPVISSGSISVSSGDYNLKTLATNITLDNDWAVFEERVLGQDGKTILSKSINAYIDPSGRLVSSATFGPSKLYWRVYGF